MKLWQAEKQAFDDLAGAETLGDIMRIGFNRVNFTDKAEDGYTIINIKEKAED